MGILHDWHVSVMPRQEKEVIMFISTTSFFVLCAGVFVALVCAPFLVDYVYFSMHDESGWLWASVCTAILLCVPLVLLLSFLL